MNMEDSHGIGLFGYIILFVIIVWVFGAFTGGFNGFGGFGNRNFAYGPHPVDMGFEDYKAICNAEKASITQTATTQYLIEQQSALTRETVNAQANALATKIDFYEYQGLRDKLAESQRQNIELKNQLFIKDQLAPLTAQVASIQCNMLKRPDITGVGAVCPNAAVINGLGINSLNNGCGSCCGAVV